MSRQVNEKKKAAASYVLGFYQSVQLLTHWFANYENLLMELKHKHGVSAENIKKMSPDEKDVLKRYSQTLRYHLIKANTAYVTIMDGIKKEPDPNIKTLAAKVREQFIPKLADLEEYVNALNSVLVNTVISNLLENSQDIVNQLYDEPLPQNE